jgi:hypothetical protein
LLPGANSCSAKRTEFRRPRLSGKVFASSKIYGAKHARLGRGPQSIALPTGCCWASGTCARGSGRGSALGLTCCVTGRADGDEIWSAGTTMVRTCSGEAPGAIGRSSGDFVRSCSGGSLLTPDAVGGVGATAPPRGVGTNAQHHSRLCARSCSGGSVLTLDALGGVGVSAPHSRLCSVLFQRNGTVRTGLGLASAFGAAGGCFDWVSSSARSATTPATITIDVRHPTNPATQTDLVTSIPLDLAPSVVPRPT